MYPFDIHLNISINDIEYVSLLICSKSLHFTYLRYHGDKYVQMEYDQGNVETTTEKRGYN